MSDKPTELPLNQAHQHAANADEYMSRGLLVPASEEHLKAAEGFQVCLEASNDENAKRTLRMLLTEHMKAAKDLERRIAKLREENKDPSVPQITAVRRTAATAVPTRRSTSPPPQPRDRMNDSHEGVDESFMLLGQRSDSGDVMFNQFWKVTTELLDNISQPVAFASVPLGPTDYHNDGGSSTDTDVDEGLASRFTKRIGLRKKGSHSSFSTARDESFNNANLQQEFADALAEDDDDDMADSFCIIPSGDDSSVLKKENVSLKMQVATLTEKLATTESTLKAKMDQDQILRSNILNARREAQRALTNSSLGIPRPIPDLGSLAIPTAPPGRDRESQLAKRVRELEKDLEVLRAENESQKQIIARFRERWNGLKESAKKKKEARAAATAAAQPVREKILEEPEPEET